MPDNYELRTRARKVLGGQIFNSKWLMLLALFALADIIIAAVTSFTFAIAAFVITGAFNYGMARATSKMHNGQKAELEDIFVGFNECFGDTFGLYIMQTIFVLLWSLLLIVPGIIKSYSYSMASYIQQRSDNKSWQHALDESKRLMDGYKGQLFRLDLSFIGWYLLGALCGGVGILFVTPYYQMARTEFFEARLAEEVPQEETIFNINAI